MGSIQVGNVCDAEFGALEYLTVASVAGIITLVAALLAWKIWHIGQIS